MGIRQIAGDPGTAGAALYWPFKITQLNGNLVKVNPGELFYDPMIGGEIVDIKGLGVPFRVNENSFIYLQVFFDLSGRPTHAGIAHTGRHLNWIVPNEKWMNFPRMYAIDETPYFGLWGWDDDGGNKLGTGGKKYPFYPSDPAYHLGKQGWFFHPRGEGGGNASTTPDEWLRYKDARSTANVNRLPGLALSFARDQIYTGIDRELRKEIVAQGRYSINPEDNHWPNNLNDVGWAPSKASEHPPNYIIRRQILGKTNNGVIIPNTRGAYEEGGYMNPVENNWTNKQALTYDKTYKQIQKGWGTMTEKLWRTSIDQVMAFYPIGYAAGTSRKKDEGYTSGGMVIPSVLHETFGGAKVRSRGFEIIQLCKSNLRLATLLEGDARIKAVLPYQGMHSQIQFSETDMVNFLEFEQSWDRHTCVDNTKLGINCQGNYDDYLAGGDKHYKRVAGNDLPYDQKYIDGLFNNQTPQ